MWSVWFLKGYVHYCIALFSLRQGDLIRRCCPSVGRSVASVLDFVIFQKRGFEITNLNLSNTTKLTLLESLPQEVMIGETQLATCLK